TSLGFPGAVVRLNPGPNPPETALAELYELPLDRSGVPIAGFSPRGGDVDRSGVYWTALASGHLASFDRGKCKGPLNGPTATGQHCPEGWTFYPEPLPQLQGVTTPGSAEASYYTWVDQLGVLGLGPNVPINTGNGSEGLLVLHEGQVVDRGAMAPGCRHSRDARAGCGPRPARRGVRAGRSPRPPRRPGAGYHQPPHLRPVRRAPGTRHLRRLLDQERDRPLAPARGRDRGAAQDPGPQSALAGWLLRRSLPLAGRDRPARAAPHYRQHHVGERHRRQQ